MLSSIVAEARANRMLGTGLFGQGGVQWVIGDGLSPSDFDELSADARAALHGSLQIKAVGAVDDNPRWAAFADERWAGLRPEQFNPVMPTAWQIQPDFFSSVDPRASAQLRDIGTFEYDAVMAAGLLACSVAPTGPLPADFGTQFWDAKESLTFEGLSGRVEFDEIGNRKPSSANVQLLNILEGTQGFEMVGVAQFRDGAWMWNGGSAKSSGVLYNGGVPDAPYEEPDAEEDLNKPDSSASLAWFGLLLLTILFCVLYRLTHRRHLKLREGTLRYEDDDSECIPHVAHPAKIGHRFSMRSPRASKKHVVPTLTAFDHFDVREIQQAIPIPRERAALPTLRAYSSSSNASPLERSVPLVPELLTRNATIKGVAVANIAARRLTRACSAAKIDLSSVSSRRKSGEDPSSRRKSGEDPEATFQVRLRIACAP